MSYETLGQVEGALKSGDKLRVRCLYDIWELRLPVILDPGKSEKKTSGGPARIQQLRWLQTNIANATAFTSQALKNEEFLLVCDASQEAIAYWHEPGETDSDKWIRNYLQLYSHYAEAKMRLGFTRDARSILEPLATDDRLGSGEQARVYLQLGDIVREESHHTPAMAARQQRAENARDLYHKALELDPDLLEASVLNAAMSLILSEKESPARARAVELGREALQKIARKEEATRPPKTSFETTWFKAVASSVVNEPAQAFQYYQQLATLPDSTTSRLSDARYRARFLAEALGLDPDHFRKAFPPLELIVFTGHNIDKPNSSSKRFPREAIEEVRQSLAQKLDEIDARVGLVSAAAGADLLFIEALRKRPGAKYHLILPWSKEEFYKTSVEPFDEGDETKFWTRLFEDAYENASTVRQIGQFYEPADDIGWQFAQEVSAGSALLTGRFSRLDVRPMTVWDENEVGRGVGGTATFIQFWEHQLHKPSINILLPAKYRNERSAGPMKKTRSEHSTLHQEVKSMLFADIVGYSKLAEKVIHDFVEVFMRKLSLLLAESRHAPRSVNTWGDAVYAVFDYAEDAGIFALQLTRMIRDGKDDWLRSGLFYEEIDPETGAAKIDPETKETVKHPLNVRVGLHTGPVFAHYNPILRQIGYTGTHVSRAARIEPVAAYGEVYASEEFAAMAELGAEIRRTEGRPEEKDSFVCEYAGTMPLAKNYPGRHRIYRVISKHVMALEELAIAVHELYCEEQRKRGKTTGPAIRPWAELPEDLRDANRAQVADIPNKLKFLGYELAPSHGITPDKIKPTAAQLEELAIREHDRWMIERQRQGWTYGAPRDNARKHHPSIVPWDDLSEEVKQLDRDAVNNLPMLIAKAGFRVRPLAPNP